MAVIVFVALCALLFVGKIVRVTVPLVQRLYLPSSVVGGLIGLAVVTALGNAVPSEVVGAARKVPGFLINVIFATLFLGMAAPKFRDVIRLSFPQLCIGQLLAWGQYVCRGPRPCGLRSLALLRRAGIVWQPT